MAILSKRVLAQKSLKRHALVIGINKYNEIPELKYCAKDAEYVARVLEQNGNFIVDRLPKRWNQENERDEVAEKPLTGKELGQALRQFILEQAKGSEALIYYAGHGSAGRDLLGEEKGYIITSDYQLNNIENTAIALDSFNDLIRKADLKSLIVILDCCHAGYFLEADLIKQSLSVFRSQTNYYLMASCGKYENSYEGEFFGGHGLFTGALLEGLSEQNAGSDGQVSIDGLYDFTYRRLRNSAFHRKIEPIRMGSGASITLVWYEPKQESLVVDETCPYNGLEPFDRNKAQFFFGRFQLILDLKNKLIDSNCLLLIGSSGSGKSSVVRAGLIPELEAEGWQILEPIMPGDKPLAKLKETFSNLVKEDKEILHAIDNLQDLGVLIEHLPGRERFLLVVDQFEEVFTQCTNKDETSKFIELLTQVINISVFDSRLKIVITMRADFLEPCLEYSLLNQIIQKIYSTNYRSKRSRFAAGY